MKLLTKPSKVTPKTQEKRKTNQDFFTPKSQEQEKYKNRRNILYLYGEFTT